MNNLVLRVVKGCNRLHVWYLRSVVLLGVRDKVNLRDKVNRRDKVNLNKGHYRIAKVNVRDKKLGPPKVN